MSKQEIIEQLKNIKDQYLNDTTNKIDADDIIEAITDVIHEVEGNDGIDFIEDFDNLSTVEKYRLYYLHDKKHIANWKTKHPEWWEIVD